MNQINKEKYYLYFGNSFFYYSGINAYFHIRAPETSTLRSKMLHAASTASLRKLFVGIDCEVQATDFEELQQEKINDKIYRILVQS